MGCVVLIRVLIVGLAAALVLGVIGPADAQELEPRALAPVPLRTNFLFVGYGYSVGNSLLDPAIPIEGLDSRMHTLFGSYFRSIGLFGHSGKVDLLLPFAGGDWEGQLAGEDTTAARTGFGDPRIRLSVNFVGAPSLNAEDFRDYHQKTVLGASVQVIVPVGQYNPDLLLNLGSNRWTFRTQVGLSQSAGPWIFEAYGGVWFFTQNPDFFGGSTLSQSPLLVGKLHAIRSLPKGFWFSLGAGYGVGGRTEFDDVPRETQISSFRFGITVSIPVSGPHQLKLVAATSVRIERGPDSDLVSVVYQYRWGAGT